VVPNWEWYRSGTLLWAAVLNLKMLTLIFARDPLVQTTFLAFIGAVGELQGVLRRPAWRSSQSV
jgi:hypothetical protein